MVQEMLTPRCNPAFTKPLGKPNHLGEEEDGEMRFCVDRRQLNRVTECDVFPLPFIDDTLDLLSGAKYFTTVDLASGYWQVCMDQAL